MDILKILSDAMSSTGNTAQAIGEQENRITKDLASRAPVTSIDGQTVASAQQAGQGKLAAQNAGIDFMSIMADPVALMPQLASKYDAMQAKASEANQKLIDATSVSVVDDPLTWAYNQFKIGDLSKNAVATSNEANRLQEEMIARNNISQEVTRTAQANAKLLSAASVDSQIAAMSDSIKNANAAMDIEQATHGIQALTRLNQMSGQQVELATKLDAINFQRNQAAISNSFQARAEGRAEVSQQMAVEQHAWNREEQLAKRLAMSTGADADALSLKAANAGLVYMGRQDMQFKSIKDFRAMANSPQGKMLLDKAIFMGFEKGKFGDTLNEAAINVATAPINYDAKGLEPKRAQFMKLLSNGVANANGGLPPKNDKEKEAVMAFFQADPSKGPDALDKKLRSQVAYYDNKPDASNPYRAPTVSALMQSSVAKNSPFLQDVKHQMDISKAQDFSPPQMLELMRGYVAKGGNATTAARDLAWMYQTANNATYMQLNGKALGIAPLQQYNVKTPVATQFGGGQIGTDWGGSNEKLVNYANPAEILKIALTRR